MYGTSYEMGVAYGALLKDEITDLYTQFYQYVDEQLGTWGLFPFHFHYPLPPSLSPLLLTTRPACVNEQAND